MRNLGPYGLLAVTLLNVELSLSPTKFLYTKPRRCLDLSNNLTAPSGSIAVEPGPEVEKLQSQSDLSGPPLQTLHCFVTT